MRVVGSSVLIGTVAAKKSSRAKQLLSLKSLVIYLFKHTALKSQTSESRNITFNTLLAVVERL